MLRSILFIALFGITFIDGCSPSKQSGGCGCGGGCGGCRHRARGVLHLTGDNPVDEDFGEIAGLSIWEKTHPPMNTTLAQVHDPSYLFTICCVERGLSRACQTRCNFQSYNENLLQSMLIGVDECPLDSLADMHFCAAQGRDHSSCCRVKGVADTLAGDKCLVFCDQIPDKYTHIDYTYASCFGKFDEMKQCFYSTVAAKAQSYFRHH